MANLEKIFDIKHINKAPAQVSVDKLNWFNKRYMLANAKIPAERAKMVLDLKKRLESAYNVSE